MLASSILNSGTFKNVTGTYPNMWNTLHNTRKQWNERVIPYYQKVNKDHHIYLQLYTDSATAIVLKSYHETTNVEIETITASSTATYGTGGDTRYFHNYNVEIDSAYYDHKFYFKAVQGSDVLTGEPFYCYDLTQEIADGTCKYIKYTNFDRNEADLDDRFIDWSTVPSTGHYLDFFLDMIDVEPNDTDESEVLEGSQSKVILSAAYFSGRVFKTGGIPDYMATRLGVLSSLDVFLINDLEYIKSGEMEQSRFGGSTLYQVGLKLTQKLAIGINVDNLGITVIVTDPPIAGTKMYVGAVTSAAPGSTEIKTMTEKTASATNETEVYSITGARFCFAYPATFGALISILDNTGFEIISGFNVTTVTIDTVSNTVYTLKSPVTVTSFTVIYKFT